MTTAEKYKRYRGRLDSQLGYNFEYWGKKHERLLESGWQIYLFNDRFDQSAIASVLLAKEVVSELRAGGNFARIICGYSKNVQRQKMHTVIFKPKKSK